MSDVISKLSIWKSRRTSKAAVIAVGVLLVGAFIYQVIVPWGFELYTGVVNHELIYPNSVPVTQSQFESIAAELTHDALRTSALSVTSAVTDSFTRQTRIQMLMQTPSFKREAEYPHIRYFREAGIRQYEGPETCTQCHETMTVSNGHGGSDEVNTVANVMNTIHYKFQSMDGGFTTYGYDGRQVNTEGRGIPVGKIDRACGVPGSFSWTGWAALIETKPAHANGEIVMRSEGCGQCHIGGGFHPATENMMPEGVVPTPDVAEDGLDCLICHASEYDMNQRYVMEDEHGHMRWNQDRSIAAAMSVGRPTNDNCLTCHQHNMGGDTYEFNKASQSLGVMNQRLSHEAAKRANPYSKQHDVHVRAGLQCLDCHEPQGHKIPRGTKGTDLVANDLPGVAVECESCHTNAPHVKNPLTRVVLNGHVNRLACETCHITNLLPTNNVLKDWMHPVWNDEEGMYTPKIVYNSGEPGRGFTYLWFNGSGTFLANALGANPNGNAEYNPLMDQIAQINDPVALQAITDNTADIREQYGLDTDEYLAPIRNSLMQMSPELQARRADMIEENLRSRMNEGQSKIYPFKLFNANMLEDLNNEGPFGAMILPFDYKTYFETGDPEASVRKAITNPIVKRMYETPFKIYMMDEFMAYFGVGEWDASYPLDEGNWNVEPRWMRQMGTLMVNHGIEADGRGCTECHAENGIMDFEALGYTPTRINDLRNLPEMKHFEQNPVGRRVSRYLQTPTTSHSVSSDTSHSQDVSMSVSH
jgi:hypothetical protein